MNKHQALEQVLPQIEEALVSLDLWETTPPSESALASTQPFCVDTLEFHQWVQFVMLVRVEQLVRNESPLPAASNIAPMAEEYFRPLPQDGTALIEALREFDRIIEG
ncbi:YqcC family protein [Marinobacteraceae bacterium S3BR75-40.1]